MCDGSLPHLQHFSCLLPVVPTSDLLHAVVQPLQAAAHRLPVSLLDELCQAPGQHVKPQADTSSCPTRRGDHHQAGLSYEVESMKRLLQLLCDCWSPCISQLKLPVLLLGVYVPAACRKHCQVTYLHLHCCVICLSQQPAQPPL